MRRLDRQLFTILVALSLLLCVSVSLLWVRSMWWCDQFQWDLNPTPIATTLGVPPSVNAKRLIFRTSDAGLLVVWSLSKMPASEFHAPFKGKNFLFISDQNNDYPITGPGDSTIKSRYVFGGFEAATSHYAHRWDYRLTLPLWAICLVLGISPTVMVGRRWSRLRAHRRKSMGLCPICGYDLRASPDRCPECGTMPVKPIEMAS